MNKHVDYGEGVYPPSDFTGLWEVSWPTGKLKFRAVYKDGEEDGHVECYWENGNLAQCGEKRMGIKVGKWVDYFENGEMQKESRFIDGSKCGMERHYYWNGDLMESIEWKNGKREGRCVEYSQTGEVLVDGVYVNDEPFDGTFRIYPEEALEVEDSFVVVFKNGTRQ